jgi:hypothetical protein
MSEQAPDLKNPNFQPSVRASNRVVLAAVAAVSLIILTCICSCTLVAVAFILLNPPW